MFVHRVLTRNTSEVCASFGSGSINPLPGHSNSTDRRFFCSTLCEFSCPLWQLAEQSFVTTVGLIPIGSYGEIFQHQHQPQPRLRFIKNGILWFRFFRVKNLGKREYVYCKLHDKKSCSFLLVFGNQRSWTPSTIAGTIWLLPLWNDIFEAG